jgi:hypothetical protein
MVSSVRVVLPAVLAGGGDDVDVTVEQQRTAAARPSQAGRELRAALEADAGDRQRMAGDVLGRRLPQVDLGAVGAQPVGEPLLEGRLVARRLVVGRATRGVEGDQLAGERDQVVAAGLDTVDELAFLGLECRVGKLTAWRHRGILGP